MTSKTRKQIIAAMPQDNRELRIALLDALESDAKGRYPGGVLAITSATRKGACTFKGEITPHNMALAGLVYSVLFTCKESPANATAGVGSTKEGEARKNNAEVQKIGDKRYQGRIEKMMKGLMPALHGLGGNKGKRQTDPLVAECIKALHAIEIMIPTNIVYTMADLSAWHGGDYKGKVTLPAIIEAGQERLADIAKQDARSKRLLAGK